MRPSKYDAAKLAPIVSASHSLAEVLRRLGLATSGGNHRLILARIRNAGLDTSHFGAGSLARRIAAVPADRIATAVRGSLSIAAVLVALELPASGRARVLLKQRIAVLELDTSHFLGRGWARRHTKATHPSITRTARQNTRSDAEVFVEHSPVLGGPRLVRRLLALGWTYVCAGCGLSEWRGQRLVLHLDHINGVASDNRLTNLRLLCPNCHSQTPTYCNRAR